MVHIRFLGWYEQTGLLGPNHSLKPYQRIAVKCPTNYTRWEWDHRCGGRLGFPDTNQMELQQITGSQLHVG